MMSFVNKGFYVFSASPGAVSGGRGKLGLCGGINNPVHYVRCSLTSLPSILFAAITP